jgi:hypothetical protein
VSKTRSEILFESFCDANGLSWARVDETSTPTPDYVVTMSGGKVYFEIKQIDDDANFRKPSGVSSRTVGDHVRSKINEARAQIQAGAALGVPSVLLIHNNLDPLQIFGTERHDFIAAMYGEMTVLLKNGKIVDLFPGRNSALRQNHNSSFSAVGHLRSSPAGATVETYENIFARNRLDASALPECLGFLRIEVTESAA